MQDRLEVLKISQEHLCLNIYINIPSQIAFIFPILQCRIDC